MSMSLNGNRNLMEMEYAVRGPIPQKAAKLKEQGREIIFCNIGNPQSLGQLPMSFPRQVLSLIENPTFIRREKELARLSSVSPALPHLDLIESEVIEYAENIISKIGSGTGAYTESRGAKFIREAVAKFIDRRDGPGAPPSDPDSIFLTDGAGQGAQHIIQLLISSPDDAIMIPIPQYPLYSAAIKKFGGTQIGYYPDEENDWALSRTELESAWQNAGKNGKKIKALVVINPGNPTGAVLDEKSINEIIDFAMEKEIAVIADEVYQENIYDGAAPFISFAKALGNRELPLFSLHSVSKGFLGECGHRGAYLELRNPPSLADSSLSFMEVLTKMASVNLCSNTVGQILVYIMTTPPPSGTRTAEIHDSERKGILSDLSKKALMIRDTFTKMDNVKCFGRTGAMYLFPSLNKLPRGTNDFDYCMALLEETGLCTVNGGGFGQKEGTQHLRIAFLPPFEKLQEVLPKWVDFHKRYLGDRKPAS